MITTSTTLNNSLFTAYNRSGQAVSLLHSEPVQRVVVTPATDTGEEQTPTDSVSLSPEAMEQSRQQRTPQPATEAASESEESSDTQGDAPQSSRFDLSPEEQKMVQQLKQRDSEVKAHEMAHLAVAGQYARGGASYTYQQGPDGRRYAIGGEVPIDLSAEKTPEETINKMRVIKRAAMAPAEPSSADRSVAASATALESQARQEVQTEKTEATRQQSKAANAESGDAQSTESTESSAATEEASETRQSTRSIDVVA